MMGNLADNAVGTSNSRGDFATLYAVMSVVVV